MAEPTEDLPVIATPWSRVFHPQPHERLAELAELSAMIQHNADQSVHLNEAWEKMQMWEASPTLLDYLWKRFWFRVAKAFGVSVQIKQRGK